MDEFIMEELMRKDQEEFIEDETIDDLTIDDLKRKIVGMINEDIERYVGRKKTISEDK